MRSRLSLVACGVLLALVGPRAAADENEDQQEGFFDRTPVGCVNTSRIRRTEIVDDRTILFYLRGGRILSNILDRECHNLEFEDRFGYHARGGRLCENDSIQVLPRSGFGFGATCVLRAYHPITPEEAELMELDDEALAERQNSVVVRPIELPDDAAAGRADSEAEPAAEPADRAVAE